MRGERTLAATASRPDAAPLKRPASAAWRSAVSSCGRKTRRTGSYGDRAEGNPAQAAQRLAEPASRQGPHPVLLLYTGKLRHGFQFQFQFQFHRPWNTETHHRSSPCGGTERRTLATGSGLVQTPSSNTCGIALRPTGIASGFLPTPRAPRTFSPFPSRTIQGIGGAN